jgi:hypothetical protein
MTLAERKQQEIETIKERTIKLKLSDADCDRILEKAGEHSLTVSKLLENFIGDLVDGTYSNGSDERMMAQDWFDRCYFGMFPENTLLRNLLEYGYDVGDFLTAWDEHENYQKHPEEYAEDKADLEEGERLWFEEDLEVMQEYWKPEESREMSEEIELCREYLKDCQGLSGNK